MKWLRHRADLFDGDLDDVECLRAVEGAFGISLEDDQTAALETVGDLHRVVCRKRPPRRGAPCLTAKAFRRLRRHLGRGAKPSSPLSDIAGTTAVQRFLDVTASRSGLGFGGGGRPRGLWAVIEAGCMLVAIVAILATGWALHTCVLVALLVCLSALVALPRAPDACVVTVRDAVHRGMATSYTVLAPV
ncbi:MAG: hypothetical protein AAF371_04305, partial [Pseudomonadota bacterium]